MARRIVSLVPGATEVLFALGAGGMLRGATHGCAYPEAARAVPRVDRPALDTGGMASGEIDAAVRGLAGAGAAAFELDAGALARARPDLVIAQGTCGVCAPHEGAVRAAAESLSPRPELHVMDPRGLAGVLGEVEALAALAGMGGRGRELRASMEARIARAGAGARGRRPTVLAVEWLDPPFDAGHWVPEMIGAAGGRSLAGEPGGRSRPMAAGAAAALDPDVAVLMPCGLGTARAASEYAATLARDPAWCRTRAAREGRVYAVDAGRYFSMPCTGLAAGVEILAEIMRPGAGPAAPPGSWARAA